ncbi:phage BppU N-terminal domain [Haloarcula tailed virus 2]|uniref:Phage BppU N-terminal domain n=1 Tax=Haloarcula tailed virus 2 TaxID=2877989 RepID=A0AAE8XZU1_9CAUD|nr:phage BppU N-terminal domain [Haloarcula tailed virus 2]UBF23159.1 phage BppU N-terminal domain [Haloarcula tailed virus 2]
MTQENQDFEMRAGDTIILNVEVSDKNGDNFDVSGYNATFKLSNYAGSDALVSYTESDSNVSMGTPELYIVQIEFISSDTEDLGGVNSGEEYFYQLKIDDGPDDISTVTEGHITVRP